MSRPLEGIRVLDLTHMLSGPFATMVLADMGAETIKVEPLCGERTRRWLENDPEFSIDGMSVYFLTLNRNKKSVAIDLKSPDGLEVFYDLVRQCDVVISNFTIGVTQRLKIEYESLQSINPRIISCCISGFGSDGPDNLRPSFDLVAQGTSGMMSVTGTDAEHPVRTGTQMGDIGASLFAATGILAAVHERGRSGIGQHVDISMLDCQISLLNYLVSMYGFSGRNPELMGNAHSVHVPYNTYAASDGHIVIAVLTDKFWQRFKQVMNSEDLDKPDFDTQPGRNANREFIEEKINEIVGGVIPHNIGWTSCRKDTFHAARLTLSARRSRTRSYCTGTWLWTSGTLAGKAGRVRETPSKCRAVMKNASKRPLSSGRTQMRSWLRCSTMALPGSKNYDQKVL